MQGHIHLERIRYPFLYGDEHSRFNKLTCFRSWSLSLIILHVLIQVKPIRVRGILLPMQLFPKAHPIKSLLKCRILKKLMALPHDVLTGQLVSVDQPDILQFDNRNQSHYRNPANVFHLHKRIFFT